MTGADGASSIGERVSDALRPLHWTAIVRLGLVQAALGAVVVLVTSTLNRVMVVEYALPSLLPGILVALHYGVQMIRPRFGYGSDKGGRRTPWIVGGMGLLAVGGTLCAVATVLMGRHLGFAVALAVVAYAMVGMGVGAAGTSLLVLMAKRVDERRRAAAATTMWILMIFGFALTSTAVGHFLDPFSPERLLRVTGLASTIAFLVALAAIWNVERAGRSSTALAAATATVAARGARRGQPEESFGAALRKVWADPQARGFCLFVFVSMLAYSAQELLLEPFCGLVFGYSLGDSSRLSGSWHAAALGGMIGVGIICSGARRFGSLRTWTMLGCSASALSLLSLACAAVVGPSWPLRWSVMALGVSNGVFAVSAIGSMMELAHGGDPSNAGVRMGLWGAAQAVAFALGGVFGTAIVDGCRWVFGSPAGPFAIVFSIEAILFVAAARLAARVDTLSQRHPATNAAAVIA